MSEKDVSANPPPSPETLKEKSASHKCLNPPVPSTQSIPGTEAAGPPLSSSGNPDQPPKSTPSSSQDTKLKQTDVKTSNLPARSTSEIPVTPKPVPPSSHISKTTPTMPATRSSSLSKSTSSSPSDPSPPSITISADPTQSTSPPEGSLSSSKTPAVGSSKLPRQRSFLAAAQKVIMQEKIKKAEEEDKAEECDDMDEDLPFEELLEKAEAGDPRAQSRLGKYYLELAEEKDTETNYCTAVGWFLKAAKQGRRDAARLLQKCWIQKKGITPENAQEVRRLSSESKFEQAVRRAAMSMYWKLNPDRKKKVAMSEMLENVSQVNTIPGEHAVCGLTPSIHTQRKILETMVSNESSSKYVDVEDFVEMTKKFTEGIACTPTLKTSGVDAKGEEKMLRRSDVATLEMVRRYEKDKR